MKKASGAKLPVRRNVNFQIGKIFFETDVFGSLELLAHFGSIKIVAWLKI